MGVLAVHGWTGFTRRQIFAMAGSSVAVLLNACGGSERDVSGRAGSDQTPTPDPGVESAIRAVQRYAGCGSQLSLSDLEERIMTLKGVYPWSAETELESKGWFGAPSDEVDGKGYSVVFLFTASNGVTKPSAYGAEYLYNADNGKAWPMNDWANTVQATCAALP